MKRPTRKASNQRGYRRRYKAGTISPHVPVTERATKALILRAMAYHGLTKEQAEVASQNREWVVQEIADVLERLADEYRLPE